MNSDLTVRFQRGAGGCRVEVWRRTGKRFPVSTMGAWSGLAVGESIELTWPTLPLPGSPRRRVRVG